MRVVPGGFQITRWVCVFTSLSGGHVEEWQETVGPNGSYHLTVLKLKPPPKLPGTQWGIMGLE